MSCLNIGDWEISLGKVGVDDDIGDDGCELTFIVELSMFVVLSDLLILYISIVYRYDIRFNCSGGSVGHFTINKGFNVIVYKSITVIIIDQNLFNVFYFNVEIVPRLRNFESAI